MLFIWRFEQQILDFSRVIHYVLSSKSFNSSSSLSRISSSYDIAPLVGSSKINQVIYAHTYLQNLFSTFVYNFTLLGLFENLIVLVGGISMWISSFFIISTIISIGISDRVIFITIFPGTLVLVSTI